MQFLDNLPKPFFVLAPMDDVTDTAFRQVISECAPADLYFTEFVNVDGLQSPGRTKLSRKLLFTPNERPLIAQIWGKEPDNFFKTAQQIADGTFAKELGLDGGINFAGVDLNMGCPQKNEVKSGTCCALMNNRDLAKQIIQATKEGLGDKLPLSVKTRTGYHEIDLSWAEFLLKQDLSLLTIHGRTKRQKSQVPADWDIIGQIRELRDKLAPRTKIIGNGDVLSRERGLELANKYSLDGIMIGRGALHDPYVFSDNSPWQGLAKAQKLKLYEKHVRLFAEAYKEKEKPVYTLNKFCKLYINDFAGASELRAKLMSAGSTDDLLALLSTA
jgi:tRNA-dihydrouridine synthase